MGQKDRTTQRANLVQLHKHARELESDQRRIKMRITFGPVTSTGPGGKKRTKADAWESCIRFGKELGIPQHLWRKCHSHMGWEWYIKKESRIMAQTSKKTLDDLVEILKQCYPSIPLTQKYLVALADSARMNQAHPKVVDLLVSICDANNPKFKEDLFRKRCNSN
jgi:hypothetical protein